MRKCFIYAIFLCQLANTQAQNLEIQNRQRVIFVHNFTRQIQWPEPFETFKIGVLGDDKIIPEIERFIDKEILVQGRLMELVRLTSVEEITDLQLVYLNESTGFDIAEVLAKVQGLGILVVSENYPYNSSMINMVLVEGNFQFEIQQRKLENENFKLTPSFRNLAITTANRWQELYQKSNLSLMEEREKVEEQKRLIDQQEQTISEQSQSILAKTEELKSLTLNYDQLVLRNTEQKELYAERTRQVNSIERSYQKMLADRDEKRKEINYLDSTLQARQLQITAQNALITGQEKTLQAKQDQLNYQKNFTLLSIGAALLLLITGLFIWKNYREKKLSNIVLEAKNREIEATSEELKLVNKEMEQFAYLASHDLQEPLNTMTGWIQMLDRTGLTDQGHRSISAIDTAANRMRILIRGLLEYSKLGNHIEFESIDCDQLLKEVLDNLSKIIEDKQAVIQIDELPLVQGHYLKLSMLFQNLISNALKFTKDDIPPVIKIQADTANVDGYWHFTLADNGIGISEKGISKIFEIFHREHSKDK